VINRIPLDELKQQHHEIGELIQVLSILLHDKSVRHTNTVFKLFEQLFTIVNHHLELEGKTLYPKLLVHKNKSMQEVAVRFLSGSISISKFFAKYIKDCQAWQTAADDNDTFIQATEEVFEFLQKRIKAEEEEFFALIRDNDR
jgi:hypothetical protein